MTEDFEVPELPKQDSSELTCREVMSQSSLHMLILSFLHAITGQNWYMTSNMESADDTEKIGIKGNFELTLLRTQVGAEPVPYPVADLKKD